MRDAHLALGEEAAEALLESRPLLLLAGPPTTKLRSHLVQLVTPRKPAPRAMQFFRGRAHPEFLPYSVIGKRLLFDGGTWWAHQAHPALCNRTLPAFMDTCARAAALVVELTPGTPWTMLSIAKGLGHDRPIVLVDDPAIDAGALLRPRGLTPAAVVKGSLAKAARCGDGRPGCDACAPWLELRDLLPASPRPAPSGPFARAPERVSWYGLEKGRFVAFDAAAAAARIGAAIEVIHADATVLGRIEKIEGRNLIFSASRADPKTVLAIASPGAAKVVERFDAEIVGRPLLEPRMELFSAGRRWGDADVSVHGARLTIRPLRPVVAQRGGLVVLMRRSAPGPIEGTVARAV
jgi:hypothetical protein